MKNVVKVALIGFMLLSECVFVRELYGQDQSKASKNNTQRFTDKFESLIALKGFRAAKKKLIDKKRLTKKEEEAPETAALKELFNKHGLFLPQELAEKILIEKSIIEEMEKKGTKQNKHSITMTNIDGKSVYLEITRGETVDQVIKGIKEKLKGEGYDLDTIKLDFKGKLLQRNTAFPFTDVILGNPPKLIMKKLKNK